MLSRRKSNVLNYYEELSDEIYNTEVLINATRCCCQEREFRGEYYGIPVNYIHLISNERNEFLSLLTSISDKIHHINTINQCIERELTLQNNSDYSGR